MEQTGTYRHERKYRITAGECCALRQRLRPVMQPDPHAGADGRYLIRSIYFDNVQDKALREKLDGVQRREKFRIRWYNDDLSFLTLEKKLKHNDLCLKLDAPLTEEECRRILTGPAPWMREHPAPLVRELCYNRGTAFAVPLSLSGKTQKAFFRKGRYHRLTRANTPASVSFRRFLPFSPWRAPARLRLKSQKSLENPYLSGAGSFAGAEMCPDKERPAENIVVLSRDLTPYGPISARQNRVCLCQAMVTGDKP